MLVGSSLGNSADCALGTRNPCHRQYTSNSHLFSYSSDHGCFAMVNSVVVVSVLNYAGLLTMMCPMLPRLSYMYIVILMKSIFFPTHFPLQWSVYVCSYCSVGTCEDAFVEVDPNLFRIVAFELEALRLIAQSVEEVSGIEIIHLVLRCIYKLISSSKYLKNFIYEYQGLSCQYRLENST